MTTIAEILSKGSFSCDDEIIKKEIQELHLTCSQLCSDNNWNLQQLLHEIFDNLAFT